MTALLPPEWLQTQTESIVDQLYATLRSDQSNPSLSIPLADLKARLQGDQGYAVVVQVLNAQAPCTAAQLAQASGSDGTEPLGQVPVCRPPQSEMVSAAPSIHSALDDLVSHVPDQAEFKLNDESNPSSSVNYESMRSGLATFETISHWALLVPLVLLALVAALGARSLVGLLRWWGIPILVTGVVGLGLTLAGLVAAHSIGWGSILEGQSGASNLTSGIVQLIGDSATGIAGAFVATFGLLSLGAAILGLVMVVGSFVPQAIKTRRAPAEAGPE